LILKGYKGVAVLAVYTKLVSGCISLRTGKLPANSAFFGLVKGLAFEAKLHNSLHL
jgi:hypothetical protein